MPTTPNYIYSPTQVTFLSNEMPPDGYLAVVKGSTGTGNIETIRVGDRSREREVRGTRY